MTKLMTREWMKVYKMQAITTGYTLACEKCIGVEFVTWVLESLFTFLKEKLEQDKFAIALKNSFVKYPIPIPPSPATINSKSKCTLTPYIFSDWSYLNMSKYFRASFHSFDREHFQLPSIERRHQIRVRVIFLPETQEGGIDGSLQPHETRQKVTVGLTTEGQCQIRK